MRKLTILIAPLVLVTTGCSLSINHSYTQQSEAYSEAHSVCAIEYTDSKGNDTSYYEALMSDDSVSKKHKDKLQEMHKTCINKQLKAIKELNG